MKHQLWTGGINSSLVPKNYLLMIQNSQYFNTESIGDSEKIGVKIGVRKLTECAIDVS